MAAPVIIASAAGFDPAGAAGSTRTATLAAPPLESDLLIGFAAYNGGGDGTAPTWEAGWNVLAIAGGAATASLVYRVGTTAQAHIISAGAGVPATMLMGLVVQVRPQQGRVLSIPGVKLELTPPNPFTLPPLVPFLADALILDLIYFRDAQGVTVPPAGTAAFSQHVANNGGQSARIGVWQRTDAPAVPLPAQTMTTAAGLTFAISAALAIEDQPAGARLYASEPGGSVW